MKDLDKLFADCIADCDRAGIPYGNIAEVKVNTRAKRRWGQCRKMEDGFHINISYILLEDDTSDEAAKNTIMHEILHTVRGCQGHKGKWALMAEKVNSAFGYNVKRTTSFQEKGLDESAVVSRQNHVYTLRCKICGKTFTRYTMSRFVKNPECYLHRGCGGQFVRVS